MKRAEFEELARKYLLPVLPGMRVGRGLIFVEPVGYLLRGLSMDSSAFDKSFAIDCFIQPLYVPADGLRFPFVFRLRDPRGKHSSWDLATQPENYAFAEIVRAIRVEWIPIVKRYADPGSLKDWPDAWKGSHQAESVGYGLVLKRDLGQARKWLARARDLGTADGRSWALELAGRATAVMDSIGRGPEQALALLDQWTRETTAKLRPELEERP